MEIKPSEEPRVFGVESPDPNLDRGPWCRMCQAEKRADNHWFETEEVVGWQGLEGLAQLVIRPLQLPLTKGRDPICGEACLQKRVAIWAGAHLLPRNPEFRVSDPRSPMAPMDRGQKSDPSPESR